MIRTFLSKLSMMRTGVWNKNVCATAAFDQKSVGTN